MSIYELNPEASLSPKPPSEADTPSRRIQALENRRLAVTENAVKATTFAGCCELVPIGSLLVVVVPQKLVSPGLGA